MPLQLTIEDDVRRAAPRLCLGVLCAEVEVRLRDEQLDVEVRATALAAVTALGGAAVTALPEIEAARLAYRALGKDPGRYRASSEALLRRLAQGRTLYQINTLVDINNLLSVQSRHPVGAYDLERLQEPLRLRRGCIGESYKGIGKELVNLEGMPVLADEQGAFGSPTSDSERAMISPGRRRAALVVFAFSGAAGLRELLVRGQALLERFAAARQVTAMLVPGGAS